MSAAPSVAARGSSCHPVRMPTAVVRATPADARAPHCRSAAGGWTMEGMRKWIVTNTVLAVAVVGLGAYAISLRSDVEDKDAQIASQQRQLDEQQGVADDVQDAAANLAGNAQEAFGQLGEQLDQIQSAATASQEETQAAIADAEQAAADARERAEGAEDDLAAAEARADEAEAQADAAGACARGYVQAIGGAFDAASVSEGVTQAMTDIEELNASCSETLAP
jgi:hypothetical protein